MHLNIHDLWRKIHMAFHPVPKPGLLQKKILPEPLILLPDCHNPVAVVYSIAQNHRQGRDCPANLKLLFSNCNPVNRI